MMIRGKSTESRSKIAVELELIEILAYSDRLASKAVRPIIEYPDQRYFKLDY